jgi:hypothetical protein
LSNSITGSSVTYASGGRGSTANDSTVNGSSNTGNGGSGGQQVGTRAGGNGGSGVVVFKYPNTLPDLTTIGAGLTYSLTNTGGSKIYRFTAGTGSVTI